MVPLSDIEGEWDVVVGDMSWSRGWRLLISGATVLLDGRDQVLNVANGRAYVTDKTSRLVFDLASRFAPGESSVTYEELDKKRGEWEPIEIGGMIRR